MEIYQFVQVVESVFLQVSCQCSFYHNVQPAACTYLFIILFLSNASAIYSTLDSNEVWQ